MRVSEPFRRMAGPAHGGTGGGPDQGEPPWTERLTINVTQAHIDNGVVQLPKGAGREDSRDPVSLALIDAFPGAVFVAQEPRPTDPTPLKSRLWVEDGEKITEYKVPGGVWDFLARFDASGDVGPFSFTLTVMDEAE